MRIIAVLLQSLYITRWPYAKQAGARPKAATLRPVSFHLRGPPTSSQELFDATHLVRRAAPAAPCNAQGPRVLE